MQILKSCKLTVCMLGKLFKWAPGELQQIFRNCVTVSEICSKFTKKTPEQRQWRCSGVFIINFEHILHIVLVFYLLTLKKKIPTGIPQKPVQIFPNIYNHQTYHLISDLRSMQGSFTFKMEWVLYKCLFWKANDSITKLMISITRGVSLQTLLL